MDSKTRAPKVGRVSIVCALSLVFLIGLWWCGQSLNSLFVKSLGYDFVFHWTMLISGITLCGLVASSTCLKTPKPENTATVAIASLLAAYIFEAGLWTLNIKPGDYFNNLEGEIR